MSFFANLAVKLGINTTEFTAGLEKTERELKRFEANSKKSMKQAEAASRELGATMGKLGLAATVLTAGFLKVLEKADAISDMASAYDASIGSIIGLGKAMELSGGKAENLGNVLSKLSVQAQAAKDGSQSVRDAFASIGVAASDVQKLNPDELMLRVAENLAKIEDPVKRNAKAFELLGKSAKGINWADFNDNYKKVADPELAAAIATSAKAWDDMQKGAGRFFYFIVKLIQPLASFVSQMMTLADRYKEFKEEGGTINFDPNNPMGEGIEYKGTGKPKAPAGSNVTKKTTGGYTERSDEDKRREKEIASIKAAFQIRVQELSKIDEQIKREGELIGLNEEQSDMKKAMWKIEDENTKAQLDLQKQIDEAMAEDAKKHAEKIELLKNEQRAFQELADMQKEQTKRDIEANTAKTRARQILTNSEKQGFDSFVTNMEAVGKMSKKAFDAWKALSIVQTIIDTYAGAQKAFTSMAGIPYVGPALGIAAAAAAVAAGMARVATIRSMQYQGRATGGVMSGNTPYLVGEKGPELVIPSKSSMVIPNNNLADAMHGKPSVVYNGAYIENLSAIDTQSATEFLSKNKEAVWAANLTAQRSVPALR